MTRRNAAKMLCCSHAERPTKPNKTERLTMISPEEKAWATYMNDVRRNASDDAIAPVELQRARVHKGTSTEYVEPNYTKDRNYKHGPLPTVPKSQRYWT